MSRKLKENKEEIEMLKKMNNNLCNTCIATEFMCEQDLIAMVLVKQYAIDHMDKSDNDYQKNIDEMQVFTCWKNKTLKNWKFLISTNLPDGMYYEVTFNGYKREWYLDATRNSLMNVLQKKSQSIY